MYTKFFFFSFFFFSNTTSVPTKDTSQNWLSTSENWLGFVKMSEEDALS